MSDNPIDRRGAMDIDVLIERRYRERLLEGEPERPREAAYARAVRDLAEDIEAQPPRGVGDAPPEDVRGAPRTRRLASLPLLEARYGLPLIEDVVDERVVHRSERFVVRDLRVGLVGEVARKQIIGHSVFGVLTIRVVRVRASLGALPAVVLAPKAWAVWAAATAFAVAAVGVTVGGTLIPEVLAWAGVILALDKTKLIGRVSPLLHSPS